MITPTPLLPLPNRSHAEQKKKARRNHKDQPQAQAQWGRKEPQGMYKPWNGAWRVTSNQGSAQAPVGSVLIEIEKICPDVASSAGHSERPLFATPRVR
jgi:hypothetical protein